MEAVNFESGERRNEMDGTIKSVIIGAIIIAVIAMIIAVGITYWYYIAGIAVVGIVIYIAKKKATDHGNRV